MFKVFVTKEFKEEFANLDESDKNRVRKIMGQLRENGDTVGKTLVLPYLREKKFEGKRVYFLAYKEFSVILAVGISDKKTQQRAINKIVINLDKYKEFILNELKRIGG